MASTQQVRRLSVTVGTENSCVSGKKNKRIQLQRVVMNGPPPPLCSDPGTSFLSLKMRKYCINDDLW